MTIALTLICLAQLGALLYSQRLHHQERRELYARIQTPELAPMLAPTPEVVDDSRGYSEEDEVLAVVRGDNGSVEVEG